MRKKKESLHVAIKLVEVKVSHFLRRTRAFKNNETNIIQEEEKS
jgi:hypothetical protein